MRKKAIFITGTGTDVGKTYVSGLLVKELSDTGLDCGYFKPVLSGAVLKDGVLHPEDCEYVINLANLPQSPLKSSSYIFTDAVSPHLAAEIASIEINKTKILSDLATFNNDYLVIEGAGGITCPLIIKEKPYLMSDLIKDMNLSIIIVADSGLGMINSTLLTVEYARNCGINIKGIILNKFKSNNAMYLDNLKTIQLLSKTTVLGYIKENSNNIVWQKGCAKNIFTED